MTPFKATYMSRKFDEAGDLICYDESKAETVLVIAIFPYRKGIHPDVVFVHNNGRLGMDTLTCFSDCEWKYERERKSHPARV